MKTGAFRPLITEKTLTQAAVGWYTFMVSKDDDKKTLARIIADYYNVQVTDVRTMRKHGKMRRVGKLMRHVKKPDWKKAMVRLAKGQKIDAFEIAPMEEGK